MGKVMFPKDIKKTSHFEFSDARGVLNVIFEGKITSKQIALKRSISKINVFRGLHYQNKKSPQTKYIEVIRGEIIDLLLCLDKSSENFGQIFSEKIRPGTTYEIPATYAHGFYCLEETVVQYIASGKYSEQDELVIKLQKNQFVENGIPFELLEMSPKDENGITFDSALKL